MFYYSYAKNTNFNVILKLSLVSFSPGDTIDLIIIKYNAPKKTLHKNVKKENK